MQTTVYKIIAAQSEVLSTLYKIKDEVDENIHLETIIFNARKLFDNLSMFSVFNTQYIMLYQAYVQQNSYIKQMKEYIETDTTPQVFTQYIYTELHEVHYNMQKINMDIHLMMIMIGETVVDYVKNIDDCLKTADQLGITMETFHELLFNYCATKNHYDSTGLQCELSPQLKYNYKKMQRYGKLFLNPETSCFSGMYEYNNQIINWKMSVHEIMPNSPNFQPRSV